MADRTPINSWLPHLLQAVVLLLAGWGYAAAQEHRFTVLEETVKNQSQVLTQLSETEKMLAQELVALQKTQEHVIDLEDFVHRGRLR